MDNPHRNWCRACPVCGIIVRSQNYSRHLNVHRKEETFSTFAIPVTVMPQQPPVNPAAAYARPYGDGDAASVAASSSVFSNSPGESLLNLYDQAARALLKQHHRYTEKDMREFLTTNYPDIPQRDQPALIHGTVIGAQTAAQFHLLSKTAGPEADPTARATAEGANRSLTFRNLGLMSHDRNDPRSMVIPETASPTPAAAGKSSSFMISADGMSLLEVHTDRAAGQQDIEIVGEEPSREVEDDLGLPTPSIELLDEPPPASQSADTSKRARDPSPELHPEGSRPSLKQLHMMSIEQRIQYETHQPEERGEPYGEHHGERARGHVEDRGIDYLASTQPDRESATRRSSSDSPRPLVIVETPTRTLASVVAQSPSMGERSGHLYQMS